MRKREIYAVVRMLGLLILFCSLSHTTVNAADERGNTLSVTETTYMDDNGEQKTIYWTDSIDPPKMDPNDQNSDFKKEVTLSQDGTSQYVDYVTPYIPKKGWYDVNKTPDQTHDKNLCFSAAASNMLHWWFDRNSDYIDKYLQMYPNDPKATEIQTLRVSPSTQQGSEIYRRFAKQFADRTKGFWPDLLQDQFINGYKPKENGGATDPEYEGKWLIENGPVKNGGFFYNVFGPDILTRRRYYDYASYQNLSADLKSFIRQGDMVTLTYDMGASAHVVTLWGVEYDSKGNLCGVYYTDSDDTADKGMHRHRVINRKGFPYVTTDTKDDGLGSKVTCLTTLSTGKATWEKITTQKQVEVGFLWGKSEFVYNGQPQKPELTTWNIAEGDDAAVLVEGEGVFVGSYTASTKLTGADAGKYVLPSDSTKSFTIVPSGTALLDGIKIYREQEETTIFDYGDTLIVQAAPRATGARPLVSGTPLPQAMPTNGVMSLYVNDQLTAGPINSDGSGLYTITCMIGADNFKTGVNTLKVEFRGDSNMTDYEETVRIIISEEGYTPVGEVRPTCEMPGKKAHFIDEKGKIYIEENGVKKEVTEEELLIPATGHRTGEWMQEDNHHFHECLNGCGTRLDEAACTGGIATETEQAVCEVCGNPYGERLEKPVEPSEKYEIISGADSVYPISPDGQLTFKANGEISKFVGIKIDGVAVDKRFYTVISGSTIVTLKAEYLNTLSAGSHTLELEYIDGVASCIFKVEDSSQIPPEVQPPEVQPPATELPPADTEEPSLPQIEEPSISGEKAEDNSSEISKNKAVKSGDHSVYKIWLIMFLLSGGSIVYIWLNRKEYR